LLIGKPRNGIKIIVMSLLIKHLRYNYYLPWQLPKKHITVMAQIKKKKNFADTTQGTGVFSDRKYYFRK
jgi:hypothetical protein